MPRMLSFGATGPDVVLLQNKLNAKSVGGIPLATDGIFKSLTLKRVKEFQSASGLVADGIVGPKTWAALDSGGGGGFVPPAREGCNCGQHDPANQGIGQIVKSLYFQMVNFGAAFGVGAFGSGGTGVASEGSGPLRRVTQDQINTLLPFYGFSIDYSTVYISNKSGAQGRPFTMAFPDTNETVQIINMGTFTPTPNDLIHEMMHVWQSQHHPDKYAFMKAAVKCQAAAAGENSKEAFRDPDVMLNGQWPIQFPFTAYAYFKGADLDAYGAEQAANAVEHGDFTVCATVRAASKNVTIAKNVTSLTLTQFGDRRAPGVVF